jgi:ferredoxin
MLDDGSCERCPTARGKGNPGLQALEAARRALAATGVAADALPQRVPAGRLPNGDSGTPATATPPVGARRAFFAGLSRALSAGVAQAAAPAARLAATATVAPRPRDAVPNVRGDETRLLMLQLARLNGRGAPREAPLSALAASDACRAHGACTRACPTGALALKERDDRFELRFDAWQCVDCGACVRLCPEHALEHRAAAWQAFVPGAVALARTERRLCGRCGAAIAGHKGDGTADEPELCAPCSKSRNLARAGFALFQPPGREPRVAPDPP